MYDSFLQHRMTVNRKTTTTINHEPMNTYTEVYSNIPCYIYFAKKMWVLQTGDIAKLEPYKQVFCYTKMKYDIQKGDVIKADTWETYTVDDIKKQEMFSWQKSQKLFLNINT